MATLTKEDQQRIDSVIQNLQMQLGFSYPEDDLVELANAAGVEVVFADLDEIRPGVSGVLIYDDDDKKLGPVVYLNSRISAVRKSFTLAHELGHHFLHKGSKWREDTLDYSQDNDEIKEESEANYFAASLLVPRWALERKLAQGLSLQALADYFQVSLPVIRNRIRWVKANEN